MPRLPVPYDWPFVVLELRKRSTLSQADFAKAIGTSLSIVSKWECGQNEPFPKQLRRVEEYGVSIGYPPAEWPEKSKQAPLFPGGSR